MPEPRRFLVIALLALAVGLAFQGSAGLFDPSEGRYAEVAREMVESGDYLRPTLDHQPHWTKPPLAYWSAAAGIEIFGANAWGARFFNAISFFLTTLLVAGIGSRLWDHRTGFVAGLVYLSSPLPVLGAASLTGDTVLTLCETAAVFSYVAAYRAPSPRTAAWWSRAMWLCFGVGFFTKGPPGLLPLVPLLVFHRWRRAGSARFRFLDVTGAVAFVLAALWWYITVTLTTPGLATYFVRDEIFARNFTGHFHRNPQWYGPIVVYLPVLLACLGAWVVQAVRLGVREIRGRSARTAPLWGEPGSPRLLVCLWAILPLLVLTLSKSRLPLYVLPLHAPIALGAAALFASALTPRVIARTAAVAVLVCLALKAAIPFVNTKQNAKLLWEAATRAGGPSARYAVVNEEHRYGLQFYFRGSLERATLGAKKAWAQSDVASLVDDAASGERIVFLADDRVGDRVEKELARAGVGFDRTESHGHRIIVAAPASQR